jgi:hypothetical protein
MIVTTTRIVPADQILAMTAIVAARDTDGHAARIAAEMARRERQQQRRLCAVEDAMHDPIPDRRQRRLERAMGAELLGEVHLRPGRGEQTLVAARPPIRRPLVRRVPVRRARSRTPRAVAPRRRGSRRCAAAAAGPPPDPDSAAGNGAGQQSGDHWPADTALLGEIVGAVLQRRQSLGGER